MSRAHNGASHLDALPVPRRSREAALDGPPPVSVHDDSDMSGDRQRLHSGQEFRLAQGEKVSDRRAAQMFESHGEVWY